MIDVGAQKADRDIVSFNRRSDGGDVWVRGVEITITMLNSSIHTNELQCVFSFVSV